MWLSRRCQFQFEVVQNKSGNWLSQKGFWLLYVSKFYEVNLFLKIWTKAYENCTECCSIFLIFCYVVSSDFIGCCFRGQKPVCVSFAPYIKGTQTTARYLAPWRNAGNYFSFLCLLSLLLSRGLQNIFYSWQMRRAIASWKCIGQRHPFFFTEINLFFFNKAKKQWWSQIFLFTKFKQNLPGFSSFLQVVVNALFAAIPGIGNVLLVSLLFWLIFSILGVHLFAGTFYKCLDKNDEPLPPSVISNKTDCLAHANTDGYRWVNSKVNFDNVFAGFLALMQVVSYLSKLCKHQRDCWLIQSFLAAHNCVDHTLKIDDYDQI